MDIKHLENKERNKKKKKKKKMLVGFAKDQELTTILRKDFATGKFIKKFKNKTRKSVVKKCVKKLS